MGYEVRVTSFPPLKKIYSLSPLKALFHLVKILRRDHVDIIHANGCRACFYSVVAGKALGLPVIWHVRETIKDILLYEGLLGLLSKVIICVSRNVQGRPPANNLTYNSLPVTITFNTSRQGKS